MLATDMERTEDMPWLTLVLDTPDDEDSRCKPPTALLAAGASIICKKV